MTVSTKGEVLINCYFDGKTEEEEYVKLDIPVAGYNVDKYPFLDIVYKLDDALAQAFDGKIGLDFTEDGVVDKEISLKSRRKVVLGKWEKSVPGNKTMDFYETRLPLEWPEEYTTKYPSLGKFTVYKNGIPMRTAWRRWDDYQELVEIGFGEYNRLVIAVPRGASPEETIYTVSYHSFAGKVKSYAGFNELRVNLGERVREVFPEKESVKIMNISLYLRKGEGVDCSGGKRGIYTFNIKGIKAYKISNLSIEEMSRENEVLKDIPLFKLGDKVYSLKDMDKVEIESESLLGEVKDLHLSRGDYEFSSLENETFKVDWFIMEPAALLSEDSGAKIEFRKINPTRYTVYAEAEKSFWLVFSESFHKDWKAYIRKVEIEDDKDGSLAKKQRFEWSALITLFRDLGKRKCFRPHTFFTDNIVLHFYLSNIPEEYNQVAEDIKKDPSDFKILSAPPSEKVRSVILEWGTDNNFSGNHPDRFLLNKSVLDSYWFIEENFQSNIIKFEKSFDSVLNYTGILNIKYIFLHKDFVDKFYLGPVGNHVTVDGKLRAKIIESKLEKPDGVELVRDSEYNALYKISDRYFLPHVYACP